MANINSIGLTTSHLAFMALFPGFFFYQSVLGTGLIGPVLGGYFSPVSMAFAPVLVVLYLLGMKQNRHFLTRMDFVFFGFILYFFFVVAFNFAIGSDQGIVKRHLLAIVHFVVVFIIFRMADFSDPRNKWIGLICLIGMTTIIFHLSINGFFFLKQQGEADDSESLATYQGFARSYFLTFLIVAPFIKSAPLRLLLYLICVPALFLNGARSEFSVLLASIVVIEIFYAKYRLAILLLVLTISAVFVLFSNYFSDYLVQLLPANRALELLDLSRSTSWQARNFLSEHAFETIGKNPLFGNYGSYVSLGGAGSSSHNIFSAWVDLGMVGFLYLLCMLLFPMYFLSVDIFSRKKKTEELLLAFSLIFATLLLLFSAKSFTNMLIGAALGQYAHYRAGYVRT